MFAIPKARHPRAKVRRRVGACLLLAVLMFVPSLDALALIVARPRVVLTLVAPAVASPDAAVAVDGRLTIGAAGIPRQRVTVLVDGVPAATAMTGKDGVYATELTFAVGLHTIDAYALDGTPLRVVAPTHTIDVPAPPPVDRTVAPPLDRTVATNAFNANEFLYTGADPVQREVQPGAIVPQRAAAVRGRVESRTGELLAGVRVHVAGRPELGWTLTRANGWFDLAVNGGGSVILQFQRAGLLPVERQVDLAWQEWTELPVVVMIPLDAAVTTVDPASPEMGVHHSSVTEDADGPRRVALLFAPGTEATMELPDGTLQPLASYAVRATEYTVGENGDDAMPADLPPTSHYTYAVELSVDAAIAASAEHVRFSAPVVVHVDNFLEVKAGTAIPNGFYDPRQHAWVADENGRVVTVISEDGGVATVDTDGDGTADDGLGISIAERRQLAADHDAGESVWRVLTSHFSRQDYNFPFVLPGDATAPNVPEAPVREEEPDCPPKVGSLVFCQNQVLGETIPITGTGAALSYRSDRTWAGTVHQRRIADIPLSGASIPASLKRIELEMRVAGRTWTVEFPAEPNLRHTFDWDGLDPYGRRLQGRHPIRVGVLHVYNGVAMSTWRFGETPPAESFETYKDIFVNDRMEVVVEQSYDRQIGTGWDDAALGLGGLSIGPVHAYDPGENVLYRGDGTSQSVVDNAVARVANRILGKHSAITQDASLDDDGRSGDDSRAAPRPVTTAPDGSIYYGEGCRLRRMGTDGIVRTVIGNPTVPDHIDPSQCGFAGDGGPASAAKVRAVTDLNFGPDGSLFVVDEKDHRVRRIDPAGIITTVAGDGTNGYGGDGGAATAAQIYAPSHVAIAPDGTFYVTHRQAPDSRWWIPYYGPRLRRISTDGRIATITGGATGDARPLRDYRRLRASGLGFTSLRSPLVHPDGSIIVNACWATPSGIDDCRVLRIGADGMAEQMRPEHLLGDMTIDGAGTVYIAGHEKVSAVTPAGVYAVVAGPGGARTPESSPALATRLVPYTIATHPSGDLLVAGQVPDRQGFHVGGVVRIASVLPNFTGTSVSIVSGDGQELYELTAAGKHTRTIDALTGAVRTLVTYDTGGRLAAVTDALGNRTSVERDASGNPTAIVAPGGQRTLLAVDTSGALRVENPAGESVRLMMRPGGLLDTFTDATGATTRFGYDSTGRLVRDEDPEGRVQALTRVEPDAGTATVTHISAAGAVSTFSVSHLADGTVRRTVTDPSGGRSVTSTRAGVVTTVGSDGTTVVATLGPDPRFGMAAPELRSVVSTSASGVVQRIDNSSIFTLANPRDVLSVTTARWFRTVNGATSESRYDAAPRTMTTATFSGREIVLAFDSLGRIVRRTTDVRLAPTTYTYDARGRLTDVRQSTARVTLGYDAANHLVSRADATGATATYLYDGADRVTGITVPGGDHYQFAYDRLGRRTRVVMPSGATHQLGHDRVRGAISHLMPGATTPFSTAVDADGHTTSVALPSGRTETFVRDAAGRVDALTMAETTVDASYTTGDTTDRLATISWTPAGGGVGQDLRYGYTGELQTSTEFVGAATGAFNYSYVAGDITSTRLRSGTDDIVTARTVDRDQLVTSTAGFTFDRSGPQGHDVSTTDGVLDASASVDTLGRLDHRSVVVNGVAAYDETLGHDDANRVATMTEAMAGATTVKEYVRDAVGRLTEVRQDGAVVATYAYDADGNRTSAPNGSATYDARGRLTAVGATAYAFDDDGYLVRRGADRFTYGTRGELLRVVLENGRSITYSYDAMGRRTARHVAGETTQYLYGNPDEAYQITATRNSSGQLATLVYDAGGRLVAVDRNGTRSYVTTDFLGSPRAVAAADGTILATARFGPFGEPVASLSPGFDLPVGFAGGLADPDTGLVRFGARDYDPASGRWTALDPALFAGRQANLYAYAGSDPVGRVDPSGTFSFGGSAHRGPGGGFKIAIKENGFSVCGELGYGMGASVSLDPVGGLDPDSESLVAEFGASVGPLASIGASLELGDFDDCGDGVSRVRVKKGASACVGPVCSSGSDITVGGDPDDGGLGKKIKDLFKLGKFTAQARVVHRFCGGLRW